MNTNTLKNRLFDKINALNETQLKSVFYFVENLESQTNEINSFTTIKTDEERQFYVEQLKQLFQ